MKEVERDANKRHQDRMVRKEKSDTVKLQANKAFRRGELEKALSLYSKVSIDSLLVLSYRIESNLAGNWLYQRQLCVVYQQSFDLYTLRISRKSFGGLRRSSPNQRGLSEGLAV